MWKTSGLIFVESEEEDESGEKKKWLIKGQIFPKYYKNYTPRNLGQLTNHKHKKHEETIPRYICNQIAENRWYTENLKNRGKKWYMRYRGKRQE